MPPITFLEPGFWPRSSKTTCSPALAMVMAAAEPEGPAPITIASNFSSCATNCNRKDRMDVIALTGGVGSGKSTVAAMLRELGATVIDADEAARAVVEPGTPGFEAVVAAFGDRYVKDGRLDRAALAELVFHDEAERQRLNAITHPLVREWMAERQ